MSAAMGKDHEMNSGNINRYAIIKSEVVSPRPKYRSRFSTMSPIRKSRGAPITNKRKVPVKVLMISRSRIFINQSSLGDLGVC